MYPSQWQQEIKECIRSKDAEFTREYKLVPNVLFIDTRTALRLRSIDKNFEEACKTVTRNRVVLVDTGDSYIPFISVGLIHDFNT